jgi:hypothetical protein
MDCKLLTTPASKQQAATVEPRTLSEFRVLSPYLVLVASNEQNDSEEEAEALLAVTLKKMLATN